MYYETLIFIELSYYFIQNLNNNKGKKTCKLRVNITYEKYYNMNKKNY